MPDFYDEEKLREYSKETVLLAVEYKNARVSYAKALIKMKVSLVKAYQEKKITESMSEDKAYVKLLGLHPDLQSDFDDMILKEQTYKGLEKIVDARKQHTTLEQSFIKNRIQSGV